MPDAVQYVCRSADGIAVDGEDVSVERSCRAALATVAEVSDNEGPSTRPRRAAA